MTLARADLKDLHAASERWLAAQSGAPERPSAGAQRPSPRPGDRPRRHRPPQT
jgi:hypothetical protein